MHCSVNSSQPSLQRPEHSLGRKSFSKLGKLFGLKTSPDAPSSSSTRRQKLRQSSPRPNSFLASVAIPSPTFSCRDDGQSTSSSDATFVPNCPLQRSHLSHSASTPTMFTRYQSTSENSTRSPTPVHGGPSSRPVMLSLRADALPTDVEEKKVPVLANVPKPDVKRRWKWKRRNGEKSTRSASPLANCPILTTPSGSKRAQSVHSASSPLWDESFEPTPPLSSIYPSYPAENLHLTPITSTDSANSDNLQYREKPNPKHSRRQSINKLARTLGVFPQDFNSPNDKGKSPYSEGPIGRVCSRTDDSFKQTPKSSRANRMSLRLTTTLSLLRPPSRSQLTPRSRSRASLSTLNTDDVHRFGLADDLSDSWGEVRNDSRASIYSSSYSPISPITFKPPTPVAVVPSRRSSTLNLNLPSTDRLKHLPDELTHSSPHSKTTLSRSRSLTFAPRRIDRLVPQLAPSAAGSRPHTPFGDLDEPRLSARANWLESPVEEEEAKARSFVVNHPEYVDEYKNWSGQWNQDDMQQVIKMLRSLK
ncbi:hypothetical protein D9615_007323 [Tricholomella constricta]|uniref:Uncharacterized protein n=1 Tax=Tricholomella constricta TaxID=117010 RepID=A0A8H5H5I1_9AGAR|nr:hypothetical protein D9615_007323 [Tricholomella constricta]